MDKQTAKSKESTAKRGRSPDRPGNRGTGESSPAVRPSSPRVPLKKRRFILADQPETTPTTTIPEQRTAEVRPETVMPPPSTVPSPAVPAQIPVAAVRPQHQSAQPAASAQSLSTDNILLNFLRTLPPGFDIAKAVADIQAELATIEFSTGPMAGQLGEDEGMSNPHDVEGAEKLAGLSKEVEAQSSQPGTEQIQQEMAQAEMYLDQQGETGFSSPPAREATLTVEDYLDVRSPVQEIRSPVLQEIEGLGAQGTSPVGQRSDSLVRKDGEETAVTSSSGETIVMETPSPVRELSVGNVPQAEGEPVLEERTPDSGDFEVPDIPSPMREPSVENVPLAEGELGLGTTPQEGGCPDTPVFNRELDFAETPQHEGELDGKTASLSEEAKADASPHSVGGGETDKTPVGGGAVVEIVDLDDEDEGANQVESPRQDEGPNWNAMTHLESEAENEDTVPLSTLQGGIGGWSSMREMAGPPT